MSTTAKKPGFGRDAHQQLPASWGTYLRLLRDRGERPFPKYTYFQGRLTIVTPGPAHEAIKSRLGGLIEDILIGLQITFKPYGQVTLLEAADVRTGTEGDECYYLTLSNIERIRGKKRLVMGQDPPPDLAVEVVATHPLGDTLKVYQGFKVPEVWVCKRSEVVFLLLGPDGLYARSPTSACLPFLTADELTPWVYRDDTPDEAVIRHQFRAWVTGTLGPRHRPQVGGAGA